MTPSSSGCPLPTYRIFCDTSSELLVSVPGSLIPLFHSRQSASARPSLAHPQGIPGVPHPVDGTPQLDTWERERSQDVWRLHPELRATTHAPLVNSPRHPLWPDSA